MPRLSKVMVTMDASFEMTPEKANRWEAQAPGAQFIYTTAKEVTEEMLGGVQAWIGSPSYRKMAMAPDLKWIQLGSAGADYYTARPDQVPAGVTITNASGAFGLSIAEYMVGSLLMLMRRLHQYRDNQNKQTWEKMGKVRSVYGSTVLIVGMGDLGGEFGSRVKALGAHTVGVRRSDAPKPDWCDQQHRIGELDTLLPKADVVALCLPNTGETKGMLGAERLSLLREDAYLINVGRGSAVDGMALCRQLEAGKLAGAVLDVTDPEPLPEDHPLWRQTNALITPHCSGNYDLAETVKRIEDLVADNLGRYVRDEPLRNVVNLHLGY